MKTVNNFWLVTYRHTF